MRPFISVRAVDAHHSTSDSSTRAGKMGPFAIGATTAGFAGLAIGAGLLVVHLVGIPLTGTSVNPARSLGPALVVGGDALRQVWLFIVAPLVGGALAAACSRFLIASGPAATAGRVESGDSPAQAG